MTVLNTTSGGGELIEQSPLGIGNFPFSVACWARRTSSPGSASNLFQLTNDVTQTRNYHNVAVSSVYFPIVTSRYANGTIESKATSESLGLNTWVPVVAVFSSSASRTLYVGSESTTDTADVGGFTDATSSINSSTGTFRLGRSGSYSTVNFPGLIAHAAAWTTALSAAEAAEFLAGGNPLAISEANLVGYWAEDFFYDEVDERNYYTDKSGNGHHLRLSATAVLDEVTTPPTVDAPPVTEQPGVVITGIKEPNVVDTLVTGVSNARARVWVGSGDTAATNYELTNQTITGGEMTLTLNTSETVTDPYIASVDWDAGGGETKFFRTTGTIVDLDA